MKKKVKILFVHSQLVQHGSERLLYEICKSIDKEQFQIEILTRKYFVKNQYYYDKLIALGAIIHTKLISRRHLRYPIKKLYEKSDFVKKIIKILHEIIVKIEYCTFFDNYDIISVIGIETYCDALTPILDNKKNVFIHNVNHKFQFERDYFSECPTKHYYIVLDQQQDLEMKGSHLKDSNFFYFPLSMNLSDRKLIDLTKQIQSTPIRIGVVSRLFKDRPNEPIFKCFSALSKLLNVELFFYGGGDKDQYNILLDELKIKEKVKFLGHQDDLEKSIQKDNISLMWLVSMGNSISYGSVEVASLGIPMIFWNLSNLTYEEILSNTNGSMHSFNDIQQFVDFNNMVLNNNDMRLNLAFNLKEFVRMKFEIKNYIKELEEYYLNNYNVI